MKLIYLVVKLIYLVVRLIYLVVKLIYLVVRLIYLVVKLIYLVVKLIYTGLVKYVILPTQIMCAFVMLRLVEKLTRPTQNPSCLSRTGQGTNATPFKF